MSKSLYLINPKAEIPSYYGAEVHEYWGHEPVFLIADLATVTVAAMAPKDWDITICEEHVQAIDFDIDVDYVGITGKVNQASRMVAVADEFRRRGKKVIIGGPYASLSPESFRANPDSHGGCVDRVVFGACLEYQSGRNRSGSRKTRSRMHCVSRCLRRTHSSSDQYETRLLLLPPVTLT